MPEETLPDSTRRTPAPRGGPVVLCVLLAIGLVATPTLAQSPSSTSETHSKWGWQRAEMTITVDDYLPWRGPLQTEGGWPLVLEMTANERLLLGIGSSTPAIDFQSHGVLVFEDPDGCLSFSFEQIAAECPLPWPFDETWVEYDAGWSSPSGSGGFQPELYTWAPPNDTVLTSLFPTTGSDTDDYGYGPSALVPGLVVVADGGPGLVFDADFNLASPRVSRNLAGFINALGIELVSSFNRTSLVATMIVPPALLARIWLIDASVVGDACGETGNDDALVRIDGGPLECLDGQGGAFDPFARTDETGVTLRIFLVNGEAPDSLADLDGSGVVTSRDAELAGYEVISNQARFHAQEVEGGVAKVYFGNHGFDFDGDGSAGGATVPGGAARIRIPPRK